jgi:branched-subunit amino acid aminotransferase/4-amino-4-deoxychorismate lyase
MKFAVSADFQLIETMRVDDGGGVLLFERHLERLRNSAERFSFRFDGAALRKAVAKRAAGIDPPAYLRLALGKDGQLDMKDGRLPVHNPRRLRLSPLRVDSTNLFLYNKTTRREIYEEARSGCDEETEVLLVNERGEITETTITNVAVLRGGKWLTPAVSCGLLPGVKRAELLANGRR